MCYLYNLNAIHTAYEESIYHAHMVQVKNQWWEFTKRCEKQHPNIAIAIYDYCKFHEANGDQVSYLSFGVFKCNDDMTCKPIECDDVFATDSQNTHYTHAPTQGMMRNQVFEGVEEINV